MMGIFHVKGQGIPQNNKEGALEFVQGCEIQDGPSCYLFACILHGFKDYKKAAYFYNEGCTLQDAQSCISLAKLYEQGHGVELNNNKAAELFAKGTELMTLEERQNFFKDRLDQNKEVRSLYKKLQQIQSEIELLH